MPSKTTGDDLVAGHGNQSNDTTWLIACKQFGKSTDDDYQVWPTSEKAILVVTPSGVVEDRPNTSLDGVVGTAHRGGAGVRGIGNQTEGKDGRYGSGNGGDGVVGHGGSGALTDGVQINQHPGMGVLGTGGIWTDAQALKEQKRTNLGGAGVVGVAGADQAPGPWVPPFEDTQGVGVYGISGVGVGIYGVSQVGDGMVAQGKENGLRAKGRFGVYAFGESIGTFSEGIEAGLHALGQQGPGGMFERYPQLPPGKGVNDHVEFYEMSALPQIYIMPAPLMMNDPVSLGGGDIQIIEPSDEDNHLPKNAGAGELLLARKPLQRAGVSGYEEGAEATLWLCVKPAAIASDGTPVVAVWRQVLLGPAMKGSRDNPIP